MITYVTLVENILGLVCKIWQFIKCFLQSYMLLIFLLTISFSTLLEAL